MALNDTLKGESVLALVASDFSYKPDNQIAPGQTLKSYPDNQAVDEQPFPRRLLFDTPFDRDASYSPYHTISNAVGVVEFDNWVVDKSFDDSGTRGARRK